MKTGLAVGAEKFARVHVTRIDSGLPSKLELDVVFAHRVDRPFFLDPRIAVPPIRNTRPHIEIKYSPRWGSGNGTTANANGLGKVNDV